MADRRRSHLVCYDIRDNGRLRRVHRELQSWGLSMQYSVFQCWLTGQERRRLTEILRQTIDERVDDLRVYALHPSAPIHHQGPTPLPSGLVVQGLEVVPVRLGQCAYLT